MDSTHTVTVPAPTTEAAEEQCALRLVDISVRFDTVTALADVSLHVPRGSITGLIGRNGAGKSTSIRVLAGLLRPDAGTAEILGRAVHDAPVYVRAHTGYLLSEPALFAYLTPRETLRFLAEVYGLSRAEGERRTDELLAFFELQDASDRLVDGFSTGIRKRLGLAAALIHAPRLLVLDEPFEALDPLIVRTLKRLLVTYASGGGSVLLSSHLIDAVDEICDRIAILERGRIVLAGPTRDAKARVAGGGPSEGTLEAVYASVVERADDVALDWLSR